MQNARVGWTVIGVAATLGLAGCSRSASATESRAAPATAQSETALMPASAAIGKPAPAFELRDLEGQVVRLADFRGKTVVLEWYNPECPFVRASHTKGSLKDLAAKEVAKGTVWLAINSGAPGKQGYGKEANAAGKVKYGIVHPILLDESGAVGRAYDARHTPHMFIVDAKGVLVYRGAIDNSPDGEGESPKGGTLVNYVAAALSDLAAGGPVKIPETEAYGCSVKYASK